MGWPIMSASVHAVGPLTVKPRACALWAATLLERAEFHSEHGDTSLAVDCADKAICVLEELLFGARRLKMSALGASSSGSAQPMTEFTGASSSDLAQPMAESDLGQQTGDQVMVDDEDASAPNSRSRKRNKKRREAVKNAKHLLNELQSEGAQDGEAEQPVERMFEQSTLIDSEVGQAELTHDMDRKPSVERLSTGNTSLEINDEQLCGDVSNRSEDALPVAEDSQNLDATISLEIPQLDTVISDAQAAPPPAQCFQWCRSQPAGEAERVEYSMTLEHSQDEFVVAATNLMHQKTEAMNRRKNSSTMPKIKENSVPEVTSELPEKVIIGCNQTNSDGWKSQPFMSDKGLIWKKAHGKIAGESPAEVAGLQYFEAIEDDWLMLGHGVSSEVMLVKESPLVKKAQRWVRCWCNLNSGHHHDCSIYIPAVDDPDYVACGVVFLFNKGCWDWYEPPEGMPVGVVHKSLVTNATEAHDFWSYEGTYDVKLKHVRRMGTAWPDFATLLSQPLPALEIHPRFTQSFAPLPIPLRVFNTFIHVPEEPNGDFDMLDVKKAKRAVRTWPCTPCATPKEEGKETVAVKMPDLGNDELPTLGSAGHYKGTCKPCAFGRNGCKNGTSCRFCHLCVPREKKRGRWNLKRGKLKEELIKELETFTPDCSTKKSPAP